MNQIKEGSSKFIHSVSEF